MKTHRYVSVVCAVAIWQGAAALAAGPQLTVVASGLNSPRGLAFAPNGSLYVAEAGLGAGNGQGGLGAGVGFTASVTEIRGVNSANPTWERIVTGLVSVGLTEPSLQAIGASGVSVHGRGGIYVTIGESALGIMADFPDLPAAAEAQLGHVLKVTPNGQWRAIADVGDKSYLWTEANAHQPWAPAGQFPDANPYGLLAVGGKQYVADAAANTLNEVRANGSVKIMAFFPNPTLPLPNGGSVPISDAVPTDVARGPDGYLYVGTLAFGANFARFGSNAPPSWASLPPQSKIYRVNPNSTKFFLDDSDVWASGFNPIVALKFGNGALYVTEYETQESHFQTGDVVRIELNADGSAGARLPLGSGALHQPNGLAIGTDGGVYVSNHSVSSGTGEVVRVNY